MIILTADQADQVRGRSPVDGRAALDPIPLKDGAFILSETVLADPAQADVADFLSGLPRSAVNPSLLYGEADAAAVVALALPDWKDVGERSLDQG